MKKRTKIVIVLIVFLIACISVGICVSCCTQNSVVSTDIIEHPQQTTDSNYISLSKGLERPICSKSNKDHQIRDFKYYSLCYRENYEDAEWSAYKLTADQLVKNSDRTNNFRADPLIKTGSSELSDYKGSGYDRGHLTPAADMSFSEEAMSETFYMSNMTPQTPSFNRDIWMHLEKQVREWCSQYGRVYVVTGPILEKPANEYKTIGANKVVIPEYFYKTILAPIYENTDDINTPEDSFAVISIAFIIPNEGCSNDFWDYAVSVDEVERRTGLDFYSLLSDEIEDLVEADFNLEYWR